MHSSLGAYTKGIGASLMLRDIVVLIIAFPILLAISTLGLKKQDK
jgi:ribosome-dependent ATPase